MAVPDELLYVEQDELRVYQVVLGDGVTLRSGATDARDQVSVFYRARYLSEISMKLVLSATHDKGNETDKIFNKEVEQLPAAA